MQDKQGNPLTFCASPSSQVNVSLFSFNAIADDADDESWETASTSFDSISWTLRMVFDLM